ncbi:MAG: NADP-dependent oxidoreductase [Elusimicrobia bacterium]|nr:NADP-dependent oxidoreductase [Elusimicrobiota bacterium]
MKAVRIHRYGGPETLVLEDVPKPEPGPGDLLVRVYAAAVNPVDWKIREGHLKMLLRHKLPLTLGWDFSGVVERVGSAVGAFKPGDEVYGRPDISRDGTYAEYIVVSADEAALKPRTVDHIHAAAVPLAGYTAWQALFDIAGLGAGQRVLVHAAGGGVGHFAVQLAKWKGAHVIGTASGGNLEFARSLGADQVVDYTRERFEETVEPVDVVLDTMAGDVQRRSWRVLKRGGTLVSILDPLARFKGLLRCKRGRFLFIRPNARRLAQMADLIDQGGLRSIVETILPLSEARQAHALSQGGHVRGKIVFRVR